MPSASYEGGPTTNDDDDDDSPSVRCSKQTMQTQFIPNPSCNIPIDPSVQCGEEWDIDHDTTCYNTDDVYQGRITFYISLPTIAKKLIFNCRDKSAGVLLPSEPSLTQRSAENNFHDPFFFEKGFYLEAKTGFQPWPGTRLMIEAFVCMKNERMKYWQARLASKSLTILELGSGVGIVGTCLAAMGGTVLVTDLPVLVTNGIGPNLKRNGNDIIADECSEDSRNFFLKNCEYTHIEQGWAQAAVVDWREPVAEQLPQSTTTAVDVIIACDCLFLRKLIDPLLSILEVLFRCSLKCPKFLFTFQRRNMKGVFISIEELLQRIEDKGWSAVCIAWRVVAVDGDGEQELYLFEVDPGQLDGTMLLNIDTDT